MTISYPSTKSIKDEIRNAIGDTATFLIRGDATACSLCSGANLYDPVNEVSLDITCSSCAGMYWLTSDISSGVVAHVRWNTQDVPNRGVGGANFDGDATITIDINAISSENIVKIKEVYVDSRKLEVYRVVYKGHPRDRIRFQCKEYNKQ